MVWGNVGDMHSHYFSKDDNVNCLAAFLGVMGQSELYQVLIITLNKICVHEIVETVSKKLATCYSLLATLPPFTLIVHLNLILDMGDKPAEIYSSDSLTAEKFGMRIAQAVRRWN
jgi:hypothetical protein